MAVEGQGGVRWRERLTTAEVATAFRKTGDFFARRPRHRPCCQDGRPSAILGAAFLVFQLHADTRPAVVRKPGRKKSFRRHRDGVESHGRAANWCSIGNIVAGREVELRPLVSAGRNGSPDLLPMAHRQEGRPAGRDDPSTTGSRSRSVRPAFRSGGAPDRAPGGLEGREALISTNANDRPGQRESRPAAIVAERGPAPDAARRFETWR